MTSKLWLQDYGYEAMKASTRLRKLGLDYMDLYLIHQPYGDVPGAWKAMEEAKKLARSVPHRGQQHDAEDLNSFSPSSTPSVGQPDRISPLLQQKEIRAIMAKDNVYLEAWAPLGQGNPQLFSEPTITKIAASSR